MSQPSPQGAPAASAGAIDYNIQVSKVDTNVLRRITVMAFKYRGRMALAIIATIIAANLQLLMPQYIGQAVDQALRVTAVGSPESVARQLSQMIETYQPDELILTGQIHDHAARVKSFEIAAQSLAEIAA